MNRWYFWVLAPVLLGAAAIMTVVPIPATFGAEVARAVFVATMLLGTIGLANPRRFTWALRGVALVVLALAAAYFVEELLAWWRGKPFGILGHETEPSLWNAGRFVVEFGVPAAWFLIRGRSYSAVDVLIAPAPANRPKAVQTKGRNASAPRPFA